MPARVLLLSWKIPPDTSGSAIIIGNLAKQFSRHDMVVAGERPYRRPAVAWKDEWPELIHVTTGWPETTRGGRWWRRLQLPVLIVRSCRMVRHWGCDTIVAVFPSEEFLAAGYVTSLLTGIPLYVYLHNTYVEQCQPQSVHYHLASWLQSRIFSRARHVFVMSMGMVDLYRERYPQVRCSPLVHSFNEDLPDFVAPPVPGNPPHFVLCGNVNDSCADAVVRVAAAIAAIHGTLSIISGTPRSHLEKLGLLNGRARYKTVSRDLVLHHLREADIVLLPHGFTGGLSAEEYRTIFPTKTIELLISGRPILAHAPANSYLARFLKQHACALVVEVPQVEAVIAGIERLRHDADLRSRLVRNALRTAAPFRASHVASTLRSILDDCKIELVR